MRVQNKITNHTRSDNSIECASVGCEDVYTRPWGGAGAVYAGPDPGMATRGCLCRWTAGVVGIVSCVRRSCRMHSRPDKHRTQPSNSSPTNCRQMFLILQAELQSKLGDVKEGGGGGGEEEEEEEDKDDDEDESDDDEGEGGGGEGGEEKEKTKTMTRTRAMTKKEEE